MDAEKFERKVTRQMEDYFSQYPQHIEHTKRVLGYAKQIMNAEGGDSTVITAAALLHDIGLLESKRKYGSYAGKYQQIEGPPIARKFLEEADASPELIDEVCAIVGSHHTRGVINTTNFHVIWDADWLVNFATLHGKESQQKKAELIDKLLITETGKKMARNIYLSS
ncbi:MAG: HD domain-containing protein [Actinomycetota bacterium]|nr:HD domain-containing protein [Actinomycetota bacterium]